MANLSTHCQIYGESQIYGDMLYTEPCDYTGNIYYDIIANVTNKRTGLPVSSVNWKLYRRDTTVSVYDTVNENHILVDEGVTPDGIVRIALIDYNLRNLETDYLLRVDKGVNVEHLAYTYIRYYPQNYTVDDMATPYHQASLNIVEQSVGGGGMGGSVVTHTEYVEKKLPKLRLVSLEDDTEIEDKEIMVINIKDFDSL